MVWTRNIWCVTVVDLVEQCGAKLDTVLIPKVGVYSDVYMVEAMLNQLEMQQGLKNKNRH